MRKFVVRTSAILLSAFFIFIMINLAYYKCGKGSRNVAFEVYDALDMAGKNEGYTKLILGDSVARQIFPPNQQSVSNDTCCLATNQAIMTVGNYILLERFIENNPQLDEVYYVARADSMTGDINFYYTYSYFVVPLYEEAYVKYLDAETKERFKSIFGKFFVEKEFPKWLLTKYPKLLDIYQGNRQTMQRLNNIAGSSYEENMAVMYLQKMKEACDERNIKFHVLSSPVPRSFQYNSEQMRDNLTLVGGKDMFLEFQDSIIYVDDAEFVDEIHLNNTFLEEMRAEIQADLLN